VLFLYISCVKKAVYTFILLCFLSIATQAQYWQQKVDYTIDVTLNDQTKTLQGFERLTYTNNSPDTLAYIWFHIWPNAYKTDRTTFSDQQLRNGNTAFYFSDKEQRGYINQLDFKVNGVASKTEDHPEHIDIIKVLLPTPLLPGQQAIITTPFHVKLPYNFSRGGYDGQTFQVTQWYPKPAVYDRKGWHPMPYLDQGEFYSEFGNYDVRITVPQTYVVAATGALQNQGEKEWLKTRVKKEPQTLREKVATSNKKPVTYSSKTKPAVKQSTPATTKTLQFLQSNVHDFAWFANKDFVVDSDTCVLSSGKVVDVYSYYTPLHQNTWKNSVAFVKDALRFYSSEVGEYPFSTLSAVQGPESFGGGMEYPTITIISPIATEQDLDVILAHEIGHNWFQGILASNERAHPWMDEGFNTFYERKYAQKKYGPSSSGEDLVLQTLIKTHKDQPITTASNELTSLNYQLVTYHKTAEWLKWVESKIGATALKSAMQQYYQQWQFKHPQPEDFKAGLAPYLNSDTTAFGLLYTTGALPQTVEKRLQVISPFQPKSFKTYFNKPTKNTLLLSPAFGANVYDKVMVGAVITNYKLPPSSFQFLLVPMYSTGAKTINGLGKLSYSFYPTKRLQKAEVFLNAAKFSMNEFTDSRNERHVFGYSKIVPGLELTFKEKSLHSTSRKYVQWKSYFINEEPLRISIDSVFENGDTTLVDVVNKEQLQFNIHQLKLGIENHRALYPYAANFTAQASQYFTRLAVEGNYFFNYKEGGLDVRLFAGKFFYKENNTYSYGYYIDRYALNLSGPNGEEDYTYSDYFVGRNRFEGLASQQLMVRDGGFKIRTDLLSNKVGKTGNWLAAINLNTTIPSKLNPLSILPVKIPLHLFADIGTYAEAWEPESETDRFLFDVGVHIPLFKETINLYFPIVYSHAFGEYAKAMYPKNRLFKTMTFSINLHYNDLKKLTQQLGL
jgi:Peptidase family M1 domain